jgi:hypothetical protein
LAAAAKRRSIHGLQFSPQDVLARIKKQGDVFPEVLTLQQTLPARKASA